MRPEQQSPKEVKVDMSMHWPPEATHDSVVVVVGLVGEIIDSQVPNGGVQLMPEQQSPRGRKLDMSMHWAPEARHDSVVIVVGASDVARGPQTPIVIVFPSKCGLQLRPEQQ